MSLLNDALRDAEKRRPKPRAEPLERSAAPVRHRSERKKTFPRLTLVCGLSLAVLLATYTWVWRTGDLPEEPAVAEMAEEPITSQPIAAQSAPIAQAQSSEPLANQAYPQGATQTLEEGSAQSSTPEDAGTVLAARNSVEDASRGSVTAQRPPAEPVPEKTVAEPSSAPVAEVNVASATNKSDSVSPGPASMAVDRGAENGAVEDAEPVEGNGQVVNTGISEGTPSVRVQADPEAARDSALERKLRKLLQRQDTQAAERLFVTEARGRIMPRSRALVAQELLATGQTEAAMALLPAGAVQQSAQLRLLKARGLVQQQRSAEALVLLSDQPPAIASHADYYETWATLLYQSGDYVQARQLWAELIKTDDTRSTWWAGLGMALDAQSQTAAARKAYAQALLLSDLPKPLDRYLRHRLSALPVDHSG